MPRIYCFLFYTPQTVQHGVYTLPKMIMQKWESITSAGGAGTQTAGGGYSNVFPRTVQLYSFTLLWPFPVYRG